MSSFNREKIFQSEIPAENAWQCYLFKIAFCFTSWSTSDNWGDDIHRLGASGSGVILSQNSDGVLDSVIKLNFFL